MTLSLKGVVALAWAWTLPPSLPEAWLCWRANYRFVLAHLSYQISRMITIEVSYWRIFL